MSTPFTYLIGWSQHDRWYYGVRYAPGCDPSDLMTRYRTSSRYVKEMIRLHGMPDVIQIRRVFTDVNKAREWEHRVLRRMRVVRDPRWLNRTDRISFVCKGHDEATRKKISEAQMGKPGRPHTAEAKAKISAIQLGRKLSDEHRSKLSHIIGESKRAALQRVHMHEQNRGSKRTAESKARMSERARNQRKRRCEHCDRYFIGSNYVRWHGSNCKEMTLVG